MPSRKDEHRLGQLLARSIVGAVLDLHVVLHRQRKRDPATISRFLKHQQNILDPLSSGVPGSSLQQGDPMVLIEVDAQHEYEPSQAIAAQR